MIMEKRGRKTIVVLAFMPLVVFGGWKVTELKGDELKGTSPCRIYHG